MANKNPIKQITGLPGTSGTFDIQDNTLVGSTNVSITTNTDKSRTINIPSTATPTVASLTVSGAISEGGTSLVNKYAAAHHLYHTWDNNTNYYDSFEGANMFRIVTENMLADAFRFQASTVSNLEYYNGSSWVSWSFDLSNLFDGNARTGVSIPYANRKFRFQLTVNGGWPTTALFMLQGTWFNDGGWPNGQKSSIIIETRANTSAAWTQKASFDLSGVQGMAGHTLSSLHTGETLYRITIEIAPWTNTSNGCALQRLCLFSNYNGGALENIRHDGNGNVIIPTLKSTTIYENGTTLSDKYLGKTATASDSSKLNGQAASYYAKASDIPTVSNSTITIKQTGISDQTFTLNGGATTITLTDNNTTYTNGTGLSLSGTTFSVSQANASTILNLLTTGDSDPQDNDWYISQYAGGGSTTTTFHRRPVSKLYNYIKGKTDTLYLGKTATAADSSKLNGQAASYYLNYNNLTNKPTIPTVNNGTLKIQAEGADLGTFTANQSGNTTINITAESLGLSSALKYRGATTTTKPSAGKYIQTVIGSTTYYVSITSSGTATQQNAQLGDVISVGVVEYVCTTAGASGTNVFTQIGDESSYALKTKSITGTGVLGGGGNLTADRTITHNKVLGTAKTTADVYKVKIDEYGHISEATSAGLGTAAYTDSTAYAASNHNHSGVYQPLDADLTSIASLTGTSGLLKKTAANTWALDTNTYVLTNDSRLSDARTPTSHTHGNITNDGKITSTAITTGAAGILVVKSSDNTIQKMTDAASIRSLIGAGTSSLTIGTTATTAAAGNHTHTAAAVGALPDSTTIKTGSSGVDVVQTASWDSTTGTLTLTSTKLSLG